MFTFLIQSSQFLCSLIFGTSKKEVLGAISNKELPSTVPFEVYQSLCSTFGEKVGAFVGENGYNNLIKCYGDVSSTEALEFMVAVGGRLGSTLGSDLSHFMVMPNGIMHTINAGPLLGNRLGVVTASEIHSQFTKIFPLGLSPQESEDFTQKFFGSLGTAAGKILSKDLTSGDRIQLAEILKDKEALANTSPGDVGVSFYQTLIGFGTYLNSSTAYYVSPYIGETAGGYFLPLILGIGVFVGLSCLANCAVPYFYSAANSEAVVSSVPVGNTGLNTNKNFLLKSIMEEGDTTTVVSLQFIIDTASKTLGVVLENCGLGVVMNIACCLCLIFCVIFKFFFLIALANMLIALTIKIKF